MNTIRCCFCFSLLVAAFTSATPSLLSNCLRFGPQQPSLCLPDFQPPCDPPPSKPVYSVQLDHYGPEPCAAEPINLPPTHAPPIHKPLVKLPHPPIPPPKLVSHRIVHYKTYVKPQVFQRIITVPHVFKFLKKGITPVVEHISYTAKPKLNDIEPPVTHFGLNSLLCENNNPCGCENKKKCPAIPQFEC